MLKRRGGGDDGEADPWPDTTTVVRGEVPAGPFEFRRREVRPGAFAPLASYAFDEARAVGVELDLSLVSLTVQRSVFEGCRFVQGRRPASDGTWAQGNLGRRPTVYRNCTFDRVRFRIRGGFSTGDAVFEDCEFRRCSFREFFAHGTTFVRCRFEGPIDNAVFYGTVPAEMPRAGEVNRYVDNDFTGAVLGSVSLRGGIDAGQQRWPAGVDPASLVRD